MPPRKKSEIPPASQQGPRGLKLLTTPLQKAPIASTPQPSPPPKPGPWRWHCHSCHTAYSLSVTRRCLECDHTLCVGVKGGKKRKRDGPCRTEFDYSGWKARGAWRRTVVLNRPGQDQKQAQTTTATSGGTGRAGEVGTAPATKGGSWGDEHKALTEEALGDGEAMEAFDKERDRLFERKMHDCFVHCDFPSQCLYALLLAREQGRPVLGEARALDAAREAAAQARRLVLELGGDTSTGYNNDRETQFGRRLAAQEYKRQQQNGSTLSTRFPYSSENLLLPPVDEADEEDSVSPCSPTSPDPPGDLMREVQVSPIERDNNNSSSDELPPPVSPGGTRRRSLLVATDTPADFATTAAPLCFDDNDDDGDDESEKRRAKRSRRKIAQLTGEEEFGPFVLDTTTSSPTSSGGGGITVTREANTSHVAHNAQAAARELHAAYSEQAWFGTSAVTTTITADPAPRSPERVGKRDRVLALLGRRAGGGGGVGPSSPVIRASSRGVDVDVHVDSVPARRENHHNPRQQQHNAYVAGEEWWDDWSDSSSSSSSSSASAISEPDTDADGDVTMRDAGAASSPPADDTEDEDESPVAPSRRQRSGGDGTDEDLRVLLRMRNAFMRGDMI